MVAAREEPEEFDFVGGRPALDLVNTERGDTEYLDVPEALPAWAAAAGLLAPDAPFDPAEAAALLPEAHTLREAVRVAAEATVRQEPVPAEALALINAWLDQPRAYPHLMAGAGGPELTSHAPTASVARPFTVVWGTDGPMLTTPPTASPLRSAFIAVAEDAARQLGTPDRARIRICHNPTCRALFFDRSQAGHRRWCSMARCGNVAKVQRHRRRAAEGQ
jgi:predicted RNA-binding Zn ribbon-like protein